MTHQSIDAVVTKSTLIAQDLVESIAQRFSDTFSNTSVNRLCITKERIVINQTAGIVIVETEVCAQLDTLCPTFFQSTEVDVSTSGKVIHFRFIFIIVQGSDTVEVLLLATWTGCTVIEHWVAIFIQDKGAVIGLITLVIWINRSHQEGRIPNVAGRATACSQRIGHAMCKVDTQTGLEPFCRIGFDVGTTGITLESGCFKNTFIVYITQREHILSLVRTTIET